MEEFEEYKPSLRDKARVGWVRVRNSEASFWMKNNRWRIFGFTLGISVTGWASREWVGTISRSYWGLPGAPMVTLAVCGLTLIAISLWGRRGVNLGQWIEESVPMKVILAAWVSVLTSVAIVVLAIWWFFGAPGIPKTNEISPRILEQIATRAFAVIAALGAVALLVLNYRKQNTTEAEAKRDITRLFTESFTRAGELVGSGQESTRLSGVYALAHLADTAPSEQESQMAIDVLCAQMSDSPDDQMNNSILQIIQERLSSNRRWRGKNFTFFRSHINAANFSGATFSGGRITFKHSKIGSGGVSFPEVHFSGMEIVFDGMNMSSESFISFGAARFTDSYLSLSGFLADGAKIQFSSCFIERSVIRLERSHLKNSLITMEGCVYEDSGFVLEDSKIENSTCLLKLSRFYRSSPSLERNEFYESNVDLSFCVYEGGEPGVQECRFYESEINISRSRLGGGNGHFSQCLIQDSNIDATYSELYTGAWDMGNDNEIENSVIDFANSQLITHMEPSEGARK